VDLLPPKIIASIGTPFGSSQEGSRLGQFVIGTQNRELGCAALGVSSDGVQFGFPFQSVKSFGVSLVFFFPPYVSS